MLAPHAPGRARPMLAEARRATLTAAALPLVCRYGTKVTTRQIAAAAGVAEGTIFRVFRDKDELIKATIAQALDAAPTVAELDGVDPDLPLRVRLMCVTSVLQRRIQLVFNLMIALGMSARPEDLDERRRAARHAHAGILDRVVRLLDPDHDRFRCPVPEVARVLSLLVFAGSHPMLTDGQPLTADEITDLLLDGVHRRPDRPHLDTRENHAC